MLRILDVAAGRPHLIARSNRAEYPDHDDRLAARVLEHLYDPEARILVFKGDALNLAGKRGHCRTITLVPVEEKL